MQSESIEIIEFIIFNIQIILSNTNNQFNYFANDDLNTTCIILYTQKLVRLNTLSFVVSKYVCTYCIYMCTNVH